MDPLTAALAGIAAEKTLESAIDKITGDDKDKAATPIIVNVQMPPKKGTPVRMWRDVAHAANGLSDEAVFCGDFNAVQVRVLVTGTSPSATISVEGAAEQGANYMLESDPGARRTAITADTTFNCLVASSWVKVRIANISGTFTGGQGFTIIVTPYEAATLEGAESYGTATHTAVNATTSSTTMLAANANAISRLFVNDSDTVIYLNFGGTAAVNTGVRLAAAGTVHSVYEMSLKKGNLYRGAVTGIHGGSGNKVLLVTEGA